MPAPEIPGFYYDPERKKYFKIDSTPANVPSAGQYSHRAVSGRKRQKKAQETEKRARKATRRLIHRPFARNRPNHAIPLPADSFLWREIGPSPSVFVGPCPDQILNIYLNSLALAVRAECTSSAADHAIRIRWFNMNKHKLAIGYTEMRRSKEAFQLLTPRFPISGPAVCPDEIVPNKKNSHSLSKTGCSSDTKFLDDRIVLDSWLIDEYPKYFVFGMFQRESAVVGDCDINSNIPFYQMLIRADQYSRPIHHFGYNTPRVVHDLDTRSFSNSPSVSVDTYDTEDPDSHYGSIRIVEGWDPSRTSLLYGRNIVRFQCMQLLDKCCVISPTSFVFSTRSGYLMVIHTESFPLLRVKTWHHGSPVVGLCKGPDDHSVVALGMGNRSSSGTKITLYDLADFPADEIDVGPELDCGWGVPQFWWRPRFQEIGQPAVRRQVKGDYGNKDLQIEIADDARLRKKHPRPSPRTAVGVRSFYGCMNECETQLGMAVHDGHDYDLEDTGPHYGAHNPFKILAVADDRANVLLYSLTTGQLLKKIENDLSTNATTDGQSNTAGPSTSTPASRSDGPADQDDLVRMIRFQNGSDGSPMLFFCRRNYLYMYQNESNPDKRFCSQNSISQSGQCQW